ncbi:hypothetical protein [Sphingomonas sp. ID0503]|uniref:hypothetical protein n=1 Tax=Sphingomonas sp. ID0503 TaxID=3399691 RepID=UPI003AFB555F
MAMRQFVTGAVLAAMIASAASPAAARPRYWGGGYRHHHYHRGGGDVAGALIGGLIIGGAAVAIANSVNRRNDRYDGYYTAPPAPPPPPPAPIARAEDTQGQAVDRCIAAAEDDSSPNARVNDITRVTREGSGWRVEGVVDTGRTRMDGYRDLGNFTCSVEYGEVRDLRFGDGPRG